MKILYITNVRMPTEKAHGIQITKMCEAFASVGHEVELVVPKRFNKVKDDPFEYYAIKENFTIHKIFSLDLVFLGRFGFLIQSLTFAFSSMFYVLRKKADIIYSRDDMLLYFLGASKIKKVYEVHMPRFNFFTKKALHESEYIVSITKGLKTFYTEKGISEEKIIVSPDGVDLSMFTDNLPSKEKSKQLLQIPSSKKVIIYTGSLYGWKGAHVLADATEYFDDDNLIFIFVGGTEEDVKRFRKKYTKSSIQIRGMQPYENMPQYLNAADVLVIPNSGKSPVSAKYTSPMKLFEYMAANAPIVSSDLTSLREILNVESAVFAEPDNPRSFAEAINSLLNDDEKARLLGENASMMVEKYTWKNRVINILNFIGNDTSQ